MMKGMMTGLAMTLFAGLLVSGCSNEVEDVAEGDVPSGTIKTLTGEVVEVIDSRTFTMKDEPQWLEDDLLTVVAENDLPKNLNDEDIVRITGTVRKIAYTEVEAGYDWDFDPEVEIELEDVDGFFIADAVVVTDHE